MNRKRIIRPTAQADIDEQADYVALHADEERAHTFLAAIETTVASLLKVPGIGSSWLSNHPRLQNIRRHQVAGFPNHLLFYRYDDQAIEILHLYHVKQDIEARLTGEAETAQNELKRTS